MKANLRKRILTIKEKGKRIVVDSKYCRIGNVYDKPINNNLKLEDYEKI